jgi:hypothetical protein
MKITDRGLHSHASYSSVADFIYPFAACSYPETPLSAAVFFFFFAAVDFCCVAVGGDVGSFGLPWPGCSPRTYLLSLFNA